MHLNPRMIGAGVAAAVATTVGYLLLAREEEAAGFDTVAREGAFSVRDYPRLLVAETVIQGMRDTALSCGLAALAEYVPGKGNGRRLPVPVLADGDEDGRGWRTRLVVAGGLDPEALPRPREGIAIRALPPRRIAAARFSGQSDPAALESWEAALRGWMTRRGLSASGPVEHAFYHTPFTPPPLRRNEVLIPLAA